MTDDQLRATADTRPGYATYPDTPPGSPCWWTRHGDRPPRRTAPPARPWTGPDQMLRDRPAPIPAGPQLATGGIIHGPTGDQMPLPHGIGCLLPNVTPLDPDQLRQAITEAIATGKPAVLGERVRIEPAPRRWWHRYTRRTRP